MEYKDPGRYIPIIFLLGVPCLGVPSKVPLLWVFGTRWVKGQLPFPTDYTSGRFRV